VKESLASVEPIGIGVSITGEVAGLPVDADISIGDLEYASERHSNIYDILIHGEYN
jgi:hypothetical protein